MSAAMELEPETLRLARAYAALGWSVVPVRPGEKIPAVQWAPYQAHPADDAQLRDWFSTGGYGIGLVQGASSGSVTLDFDGEDGQATMRKLEAQYGPLPHTACQITPGGGMHVIVRHPGRPVPTRRGILPGFDVRGDGGFIVAHPSVHATGRRYEWDVDAHYEDVQIAPCPDWVADLICGPAEPGASSSTPKVETTRAGSLGLLEAAISDGRETYMRDTVLAVLRELRDKLGRLPSDQELFDAAWPQYSRKVDFTRPGRGQAEVMAKCRYTLRRVASGAVALGSGSGSAGQQVQADGGLSVPQQQAKPGLPLVYFNDIKPNLDAADFVEGLLIEGGMSVVYGESNCGKTFFMTDLALHIAMFEPWRGRAVERGGVIYCALEGSHGISNRVAAFRKHHGLDGVEIPFAVIPSAINMLDPAADTSRLIAAIKQAAEHLGERVLLVVIDTLSRAMSGGNENAPDDMGALVSNTDRVRQETGAHVAYVHHSGKDVAKGARGHSLLRAATDTEIEVSREDPQSPSKVRVTKQREMEIEGEFRFVLKVVELGTNRRGKPVTSCVITEPEGGAAAAPQEVKVTRSHAHAMRMLKNALASFGVMRPPSPDRPGNLPTVSVEEYRKEFYAGTPDVSPDGKRVAFNRAIKGLLSAGAIASNHDLIWIVRA